MSVLSKEEYMNRVKAIVGDNADDESLAFVEDMSDTYDDMEQRTNNGGEDWKTKYEENDANWRRKYKERFFGGKEKEDDDEDETEDRERKTSFDELFE